MASEGLVNHRVDGLLSCGFVIWIHMAFHPVLGIPRLKTVPGGHMSGDYSHWFSRSRVP